MIIHPAPYPNTSSGDSLAHVLYISSSALPCKPQSTPHLQLCVPQAGFFFFSPLLKPLPPGHALTSLRSRWEIGLLPYSPHGGVLKSKCVCAPATGVSRLVLPSPPTRGWTALKKCIGWTWMAGVFKSRIWGSSCHTSVRNSSGIPGNCSAGMVAHL